MQLLACLVGFMVIVKGGLIEDIFYNSLNSTQTSTIDYTGNDLGEMSFYGHSWNVPRVSIPSIYGYTNWGSEPTKQGEDSWFYAGHVTDTDGKQYAILTMMIRNSKTSSYRLLFNIADDEAQTVYSAEPTNAAFDDDEAAFFCAKPEDNQFFVGFEYQESKAFYKLADDNEGYTGMKGAKYQIYHEASDIAVSLYVEDMRGTLLENMNGMANSVKVPVCDEETQEREIRGSAVELMDRLSSIPNDSKQQNCDETIFCCTYEVAQPILKVYNTDKQQSTITIHGKTIQLESGEIWMDRQVFNYDLSATDQPLYIGNWLVLRLNEYSIALNNVWSITYPIDEKDHYVWQSGTETGYPPLFTQGVVWYSLPDTIEKYYQMNNGGKFLAEGEFAVNILNTQNPDESPHYTSPTSGITYATAWKIDITLDYVMTVYMFAMVDECEVMYGLWEGATFVYSDPFRKTFIGYGWAEQNGYN